MSALRQALGMSVVGSLVAFGIACGGSTISVGADQAEQKAGDAGGSGGDGGGSTPSIHVKGAPCVRDSDCGPASTGSACGFEEKLACAAKGACFGVTGGAMCNAFSPGCACDGTVINTICNDLPTGYQTKPLAHAGACNDAGP